MRRWHYRHVDGKDAVISLRQYLEFIHYSQNEPWRMGGSGIELHAQMLASSMRRKATMSSLIPSHTKAHSKEWVFVWLWS